MKFLTTTFLILINLTIQAQDYKSYLSQIKSLSQEKRYYSADSLTNLALNNFPNDHDLMCYRAWINAWNGELLKADSMADQVLVYYPEDIEAYEIKATIAYWSGESEKLLIRAQEFLLHYPDKLSFKYYEAYAYFKLGMIDKSTELVKQLLEINSEYQPGVRLLKDLRSTHYSFLETEVNYAHFSSALNPWQQIRMGFGMNKKIPWNGHLLAVNRFDTKGFSLELEAYPRINKQSYVFLHGSYSPNRFMANYTAGLEFFQRLQNFEISIGSKRFKFNRDAFFLHKASLGYYKKGYFVHYQLLLSHALNTRNYTHILRLRTYLKAGHYLEGELMTGTNVQEYFNTDGIGNILENKGAVLKYFAHLNETSSLLFGIRVRSEEYRAQTHRIRTDFQLGVKIKLH